MLDLQTGHDIAGEDKVVRDGGMSLDRINSFIDDMIRQPAWRVEADLAVEYYDGNQLTPAERAEYVARGLPPVVVNMVKPTINMVLGMEALSRTDFIARPEEGEGDDELARALTWKLKEAEDRSRADRACADAYAGMVKAGIGWVEVARESNPFRYAYRCGYIDRREIWWDSRARQPDLSDARYLVRRKWYDTDAAAALFPEHADMIRAAGTGWAGFDHTLDARTLSPVMLGAREVERDWGWDDTEWRDSIRQRVCLYEWWYRVPVRGHVIKLASGRVIEFDKKNPVHKAAVASGKINIQSCMFYKIRRAWFLGPHRLSDEASPYKHGHFPYVPFFGYREDLTGVPYGLIRDMRPMQDEVNRRRAKMLWQLSAVRVQADDDAVADWNRLAREISRPDAMIKRNPDRKNRNAKVDIDEHQGLNAQQFQVYGESKNELQDVAGVFNAQLGKEMTGQSGVAIRNLVEQGTTTLAEINDNYRFSRMMVGDMMMSLIIEDIGDKETVVKVPDRSDPSVRRPTTLNKRVLDKETGTMVKTNDVQRVKLRVALDEVPNTATHKQMVYQELMEFMKLLPEPMRAAAAHLVVQASDVPFKRELADALRQFTGTPKPLEDMSEEEQEAHFQALAEAAKAKEQQDVMDDLTLMQAAAEVDDTLAGAEEKHAKAASIRATTDVASISAGGQTHPEHWPGEDGDQESAAPADGSPDDGGVVPSADGAEAGGVPAVDVGMTGAEAMNFEGDPNAMPTYQPNIDAILEAEGLIPVQDLVAERQQHLGNQGEV